MRKEKIIKACSGAAIFAGLVTAFVSAALGDGGAPLKEVIITGLIAIAVAAVGVVLGFITDTIDDSTGKNMLHCDGENEAGAYDKKYQFHRVEDVIIEEDEYGQN